VDTLDRTTVDKTTVDKTTVDKTTVDKTTVDKTTVDGVTVGDATGPALAEPGCPADPDLAAAAPLAGFTIGVTAARRADELAALLERRGASVLHAPAIRIIPLADDAELERATEAVIANPPQLVVATTGIGFRGWIEAADGWGHAEALHTALAGSRLLARGPKATGAIRAAGLREEWSPASESSAEVLAHLLAEGVDGVRIAVQLHGATTEWEPLPDFGQALRDAGAEVVAVPVYRWTMPSDTAPMDRLLEATVCGAVDSLSFTSAPAVASMLERARQLGLLELLLETLGAGTTGGRVMVACVGPVTAGPLEALGVPTVQPARARLGSLARHLAEELPARATVLDVAGHTLALRGQAVLVDGRLRAVPPAGMALLRALARRPGRVLSREELLAALPGGGGDTHAVETAVARLRSALGAAELVQTVVKRGYRLALA
jgi:uroporphyrinogen-III synthase